MGHFGRGPHGPQGSATSGVAHRFQWPLFAEWARYFVLFVLLCVFPGVTHVCLSQADQRPTGTQAHAKKSLPHHRPRSSKNVRRHTLRQQKKNRQSHPVRRNESNNTVLAAGRNQKGKTSAARSGAKTQSLVVSLQLGPLAQQLATSRTPAAYAAVLRYAHTHTGSDASLAYLALGNAYLLDHRYKEAVSALSRSQQLAPRPGGLADHADYLAAKAEMAQQNYAQAEALLMGFRTRYPDSALKDEATLLLAQTYIAEGGPQSALHQLALLDHSKMQDTPAYLLTLAQAKQMAGDRGGAIHLYVRLYTEAASSDEAGETEEALRQMGVTTPFTAEEEVQHAEGLAQAHADAAAAKAYEEIAGAPAVLGTPAANLYRARAVYYEFLARHYVSASGLARVSDTNDEAGALRLYLMVELERDNADPGAAQRTAQQMLQQFPASNWTAEALFSAGNMALLGKDAPTAIQDYSALVNHFPASPHAAIGHWHVAWLNYRLGDKKTAARLFEEQVQRWPTAPQASAALYWRGRIYEDAEKNAAAARACYDKLIASYRHSYYADLARMRVHGARTGTLPALPFLSDVPPPQVLALSTNVPEQNIHWGRARALANAGLYRYVAPEVQAVSGDAAWDAYAEARLYAANGEAARALHAMLGAVPSYISLPVQAAPRDCWEILFPRAYWPMLQKDAQTNGLDPYLVAGLVRQESGFNPRAVSGANAYGLMQLLPAVGRAQARKLRLRQRATTASLLDPGINLQLGAAYLHQLLDGFNGQTEYALAAYNAGDDRVKTWLADGPYADVAEFVESVPFTQTRDYVQSVLRNAAMYRKLYANGTDADE